jgi:hypothetical protein
LLLSFLLLTLRPATPLRRHLITHLDTLLALGWLLYAYRDIWPLLTYHLVPTDLDNAITWSRVGLLTLAAVVIPLFRPRTYVPADPENPSPPDEIHPEQTASWISFIFFEFMTPLVWKAWKTTSLPYDELVSRLLFDVILVLTMQQPMADYDKAQHLYKVCSLSYAVTGPWRSLMSEKPAKPRPTQATTEGAEETSSFHPFAQQLQIRGYRNQ